MNYGENDEIEENQKAKNEWNTEQIKMDEEMRTIEITGQDLKKMKNRKS